MTRARAGRGFGWAVGLAVLLLVAVVAWRMSAWRFDGSDRRVSTHGFDLSAALVPADRIIPTELGFDGLPSLDDPPMMPGAQVAAFNDDHRGKYLVSSDRVIGIVVDGQARAYPIRVINWHEVANDTIGELSIVVSYNPLCDSVAVFDRRVAGAEPSTFGVSGLVYNSNLLLFDRQERRADSSLWSQLLGRAIAGPAAARGATLRALPVSLASWSDWLARHPDTQVVRPDPDLLKRYQKNPYGNYLLTGKPRFPVSPAPPESSWPPMTHVLAIERAGRFAVFPLNHGDLRDFALAAAAQDVVIEVDLSSGFPSTLVHATPATGTFYARWFAWYAHHPEIPEVAIRPD